MAPTYEPSLEIVCPFVCTPFTPLGSYMAHLLTPLAPYQEPDQHQLKQP